MPISSPSRISSKVEEKCRQSKPVLRTLINFLPTSAGLGRIKPGRFNTITSICQIRRKSNKDKSSRSARFLLRRCQKSSFVAADGGSFMFVLIAPRVEYTILVDFLVGQRQVNDKVKVKAFFAMMTRKLHPPQTVPTCPGLPQVSPRGRPVSPLLGEGRRSRGEGEGW